MHPKKILIVEDEARLAELLVAGLQKKTVWRQEAVHDTYLGKRWY